MSKEASPLGPVAPAAGSVLPDVAAIVVNYGTAELALQAVESLLAQPERLAMVHLVDNASPGGDGAVLARAIADRGWEGRVTLHAERVNHGFGRGNNLALEVLARAETRPRHVLLLNPDARVEGRALEILAEFLDAHPRAGAVGAAIDRPGRGAVSAAFRFPTGLGEVLQPLGGRISRLFGVAPVAMDPAALAPGQGPQRVDWVSGAAVMFRFEALAEVGFFDPDFFLYFEETELMWRLARAGHEIWVLPGARVLHEAGAATGMQEGRHRSRRQPSYWYDSWRLYFVKTKGAGAARIVALGRYATGCIALAASALRLRKTGMAPGFAEDFARFVLWPLFGGQR